MLNLELFYKKSFYDDIINLKTHKNNISRDDLKKHVSKFGKAVYLMYDTDFFSDYICTSNYSEKELSKMSKLYSTVYLESYKSFQEKCEQLVGLFETFIRKKYSMEYYYKTMAAIDLNEADNPETTNNNSIIKTGINYYYGITYDRDFNSA